MGHLSTHVLDTMNGCPAAGMRVTLEAIDADGSARTIKTLTLNNDGRNDGGPLLVLAGPGTGKTTTLVEAAVSRVGRAIPVDQLLMLTFSRRAAGELRDRVTARLGGTLREPIARTLYADAAQTRWTQALADLGMTQQAIDRLTRSPDAGRVCTTLDVLTRLAPDAEALLGGLITALDPDTEPASALLSGARAYLDRHGDEARDIGAVPDAKGLDPAGRDLLAQVNQLIDERLHALTDAALLTHPHWLDRLGPEPVSPAAHAAWLAEITTTSAHHDRVPAGAATPSAGLSPSRPISR